MTTLPDGIRRAVRLARRRFGDTHEGSTAMSEVDRERVARVAREQRTAWVDDLRQDLRHGARAGVR